MEGRHHNPHNSYRKEMYLFDLLLVLGLYSCDSSSMPFCLLYQSNSVCRMEGRQYSQRELIELTTCREKQVIKRPWWHFQLLRNFSLHKKHQAVVITIFSYLS